MSMNVGNFLMLGPKENPVPEDYELEVALLENEGWRITHTKPRRQGAAQYLYEEARRFRRVARRLRWATDLRRAQRLAA